MRHAILAILALSIAGAATLVGSGPASAHDYPWCAQGRGVGIPGECAYSTYAQCTASVSGRGLYCNINPRVAFREQLQERPYRQYRYRY